MDRKRVQTLLKKVGKGKTLARDLTEDEADEAISLLLSGAFAPVQIGAFLQAMRIKETTREELVGAAKGLERHRIDSTIPPEPSPLVVNLAFDTSRKGGLVSVLAAAFLRRTGLAHPILVWEPPTLFPAADAMGGTLSVLRSHAWLAQGECPLVAVRDLVGPWEGLAPLRADLGFRSILNTLEKLATPWPGAPVVVGISHGNFFHRLAGVLTDLGASRAAIVQGHHGTCDLDFGTEPVPVAIGDASGIRDEPVAAPVQPDSSLLLLSSLPSWSDRLSDPSSSLWAAIRRQAAFFHAFATGTGFDRSREIVESVETRHAAS